MQADIRSADRGEPISAMEPLVLSEGSRSRSHLTDLAFDLTRKSSAFRGSLRVQLVESLAALVRSMNCYYSNLIEGHYIHPVDIERALREDFASDARTRNLQMEAKAHIAVQEWIDRGALEGGAATTMAGVVEVHRRFGNSLPDDLLWVEDPARSLRVRMVPGQFRNTDVQVGRHVAVSPGAVPRFLARFQQVYAGIGTTERILAIAAAHHRLLWLHPFLDGNGRVARLMSHAQFVDLLDTGGLWSVARGLARNVRKYKTLLANCDEPRRHDLDGRGALSEEALSDFTTFFLEVCIDQVSFMESLLEPDRLRSRILQWAEEEARAGQLPARAGALLEAVLYRGEVPRGDADTVLGTGERQARRVISALIEKGVLVSENHRAPLRLGLPARLSHRLLPGLFPEELPPD